MKAKLGIGAIAFLVGASWAQVSHASVVLSDDFNSDTPMLNWTGDSSFNVVPNPPVTGSSSVDLIPINGQYDFFPGNGNYVDLDGSTGYGNPNPVGEIESKTLFGAGTYTLSFDLGGNARPPASAQTTDVYVGSQLIASIGPLASSAGLDLYNENFSTTGGNLIFEELNPGGSDQQGNILDNVILTQNSSIDTPLPSAWSMLLTGLLGLGFMAIRGRKKSLGAAAC